MVIVTAGEARYPRRDLAPATRFMYLMPLFFYILLSFVVGFNINYGDPDLPHPWLERNSGLSPFIIVLKSTRFQVLPDVVNACFVISAYSAGNTGLYVSSRTLFALAQKYGNRHIKKTLGRTSAGHTPTAAILCCSIFGFITFLSLPDQSPDQVIITLSAFVVGGLACVYASESISFIRFRSGLERLRKRDKLSRDDPPYTTMYYRAHWQPLCAYFGLLGCILLVIFSGWAAIYILSARRKLGGNDGLKSSGKLAADLIGAYSAPIIFFILYITYKYIHSTSIRPLRDLNETLYLPPEFEWDTTPMVHPRSCGDWLREIWSLTI